MRPERGADAVGVRQRVADRQPHVGLGQLGDGGTVGEIDHRVHDRLRVHHDVDVVERDAEATVGRRAPPNSSCASITSSPLFINVEESTVILGPIFHVGWASASSMVTSRSSLAGAATERASAGGEHDARHPTGVVVGAQALVHGAMLAVDGDELGPGCAACASHDGSGSNQ